MSLLQGSPGQVLVSALCGVGCAIMHQAHPLQTLVLECSHRRGTGDLQHELIGYSPSLFSTWFPE